MNTEKPQDIKKILPESSSDVVAVAPVVAAAKSPDAPQKNPSIKPEDLKMVDTRPKTRGDRFYDITQFMVGKLFILGITAVLAFTADKEFGPKKILGIPNYLKKAQIGAEKLFKPLAEKGGNLGKVLAGGAAGTLILSHGGNFFAPFIKSLENNREGITNWYNKKYGTEEEVRITKEKYKDMPKQNWGDVIKGRATAWATVFTSITAAYLAFGKSTSKNEKHYFKLDWYEDIIGRKFAWLSKNSRDISKISMEKTLSEAQRANKFYRFGKVAAIDAFATTTAILVWNTVSRLSAKKRVEKENGQHHDDDAISAPAISSLPPAPIAENEQGAKPHRFADKIQSQAERSDDLLKSHDEKQSFSNVVSEQRIQADQNKVAVLPS